MIFCSFLPTLFCSVVCTTPRPGSKRTVVRGVCKNWPIHSSVCGTFLHIQLTDNAWIIFSKRRVVFALEHIGTYFADPVFSLICYSASESLNKSPILSLPNGFAKNA